MSLYGNEVVGDEEKRDQAAKGFVVFDRGLY
jgi:hypothetical protein